MSTYYVRKTGSDANPGTSISPKRTILAGIGLLGGGDTLIIGDGEYNEQILNTLPSNTTLQAENANQAVLKPTAPAIGWAVININQSYVVNDGLVADATYCVENGGWYVTDSGGLTTHVTIKNGTSRNGLREPSTFNALPNGILLNHGATFHTVRNMHIHDFSGHGIYTPGENVLEWNLIHDCKSPTYRTSYGIHSYSSSGFDVNRARIRYNVIYSVDRAGIIICQGDDPRVYNNLVTGCAVGIEARYGATNPKIWNNTVCGNVQSVAIYADTIGSVVQNNILFANDTDAIFDETGAATANHNLIGVDPQFVDAPNGDFSLQDGSPAEGAGVDLSAYFTDDITGATRSTWDIGAYAAGSSGAGAGSIPGEGDPGDNDPAPGDPPVEPEDPGSVPGGESGGVGLPAPESLAVLMALPTWPVQHTLEMDNYIADFGDGFEQRAGFNLAYSRADGEGSVSSYKGRNRFVIRCQAKQFEQEAAYLWNFYKARNGSLEPFFFYNFPDERGVADPTGADPLGRYKVRFADPQMDRERFALKFYNYGIALVEVRELVDGTVDPPETPEEEVPAEGGGTDEGMNLVVTLEMSDNPMHTNDLQESIFTRCSVILDPDDYDGATYYFECVAANSNSLAPYTVQLETSDADGVASIIIPAHTMNATRKRSAAFTLDGEKILRIKLPQTANVGDLAVMSARIVIQQVGATKTRVQIPLGLGGAISFNDSLGFPWGGPAFNQTSFAAEARGSIWKKEDAFFATIAGWTLETIGDCTSVSSSTVVALFNKTTSTQVTGVENVHNFNGISTTLEILECDFANDAANFTDGNEFEIRSKVVNTFSAGSIFAARLYVRVTDLEKAMVYNRVGGIDGSQSLDYVNPNFRSLLATGYFSPASYFMESVGREPSAGAASVELVTSADDVSVASLTTVAGSSQEFNSASKIRKRSTAIPLVADGRYMTRYVVPSGSIEDHGTLLLIAVEK